MPNFRRVWVPGASYFFTVNLHDRSRALLVEQVGALRAAFREAARVRPFEITAAVVLPEHLHCLWRLPEGDADNATRWRHIKTLFTRAVHDELDPTIGKIWQARYWERLIRDERDLWAHVDYIHYNPVKHGHVERALDWPHSSFHRFVRQGVLAPDWGTSMRAFAREVGEQPPLERVR